MTEIVQRAEEDLDVVADRLGAGPIDLKRHVRGQCMACPDAAVLLIPKNASTALVRALGSSGFRREPVFDRHPGSRYVIWRDPIERYRSGVAEAWQRWRTETMRLDVDLPEFVARHMLPYHDEHLVPQAAFVNGPVDEFIKLDDLGKVLPARLNLELDLFSRFLGNYQYPDVRMRRREVLVDEAALRRLYPLDFAVWESL